MSVTKLAHRDMAVIIITLPEFDELLTALGYAIGMELQVGHGTQLAEKWMHLSNSINEGSPDWKPYDMETIKDLAFGGGEHAK